MACMSYFVVSKPSQKSELASLSKDGLGLPIKSENLGHAPLIDDLNLVARPLAPEIHFFSLIAYVFAIFL